MVGIRWLAEVDSQVRHHDRLLQELMLRHVPTSTLSIRDDRSLLLRLQENAWLLSHQGARVQLLLNSDISRTAIADLLICALSWPVMALLEAFSDVEKLIDAGNLLLTLALVLSMALKPIIVRRCCCCTVETFVEDGLLELLGQDARICTTSMVDGLILTIMWHVVVIHDEA